MLKRGHFSRSRGIDKFDEKFGKDTIVNILKKALKKSNDVSLLEIGCGEGRVLMQLRKLFPRLKIFGINKEPWLAMKGSQSLKKTGIYYKIFTKKEINKVDIPKIYFYDAKKLNFPSNSIDIAISQIAIHYVQRKDLLIEEVWRVLKKGGVAYLHFDSEKGIYPDFMKNISPRFTIYKNNKPYSVVRFLNSFRKKGFDAKVIHQGSKYLLILHKNTTKPLKLGLKFDELSSIELKLLDPEKKIKDIFFAYRSVYKL